MAAALRSELEKSKKALFVAEAHMRAMKEERDFYYSKLEMIEASCNEVSDAPHITERVITILHMSEDEVPFSNNLG